MASRIRKGDRVRVMAGKFKGAEGVVLSVDSARSRVTVERVNVVKRHTRPNQRNRQGGIVEREASIHISNVALLHQGEPTRVRFELVDGTKQRFSVKHDEAIDG